jgi:zeta-carotene desaturase
MAGFSLNFVVVMGVIAAMINMANCFMPMRPTLQRLSVKSLRMDAEKVKGDEGLLDPNRMERALKGTGIKVPASKKLRVGIIGGGLGAMITAMELADAGHDVQIFESRRFHGGKVGSWIDADGNHVEMGLHVFFGCYYNLFGIMKRVGAFQNLRLKEHTHTFINEGGKVGMLDFRLGGVGAPLNGLAAFARSEQLNIADKFANAVALATSPVVRALFDFDGALQDIRNLDNISFSEWFIGQGGSRGSINRMWDPIAYALGFMDCDNTSARCMLTIFQLFAVRTEASILRMLEGSPNEFLHKPIVKYLEDRGVEIFLNKRVLELIYEKDQEGKPTVLKGFKTGAGVGGVEAETRLFDVVVAATDVPGIQKLLPPDFRKYNEFDKVYNLDAVPVQTVQLRFNGWVTELVDAEKMKDLSGDKSDGKAPGIDNLLYSPDVEFSCFADLAITSPGDYYKEGEGSLMQCVLTPGDKWMPVSTEAIAMETIKQVKKLFPSAANLECTWWNVVKLGKSLYREGPGMDVYRPSQVTPVPNFFLAGSYTFQDYIDSMEGATKSGMLCADAILARTDMLQAYKGSAPFESVKAESVIESFSSASA